MKHLFFFLTVLVLSPGLNAQQDSMRTSDSLPQQLLSPLDSMLNPFPCKWNTSLHFWSIDPSFENHHWTLRFPLIFALQNKTPKKTRQDHPKDSNTDSANRGMKKPNEASHGTLQIQHQKSGKSLLPPTKKAVSIWWYIFPISGFALLFSLYRINRKKY